MSMITEIMRKKAECGKVIRKKYPGLPYYDCPNLDVYMIIAYGQAGKSYPEETLSTAEKLEQRFILNSMLSSLIGRPLDWIHDADEAEYYLSHSEEYENLLAIYESELHSFRYIVSELEKRNVHAVHPQDDGLLVFDCMREELDPSDKWSPSIRKINYPITVKPFSVDAFLKQLSVSGHSHLISGKP